MLQQQDSLKNTRLHKKKKNLVSQNNNNNYRNIKIYKELSKLNT